MSEKDPVADMPKILPVDVDRAFEVLFNYIYSFQPFLEAQTAAQRITETNFWFNQATLAKQRHEQIAAQQKAQQQAKNIVLPVGGKT